MTRAEMLTELRTALGDDIPDYGWSDTRLLAWLSEGQDTFCADTGYFVDFTNYTITTVSDQAVYSLDDRIIQVLDVFYNDTLRLGKIEDRDRLYPAHTTQPARFDFSSASTPSYYQTDEATGSIRFFPTPEDAGETLNLRVWRYSQNALSNNDVDGAGTDAEPELPERFQFACIEWAAHKAFMDHDAERQDKVKAEDHLKAYRRYVSAGKEAHRRRTGQTTVVQGHPIYVVQG